MVTDYLSQAGHKVSLFEKRKATGRKLLIAGSSGLNISNQLPLEPFKKHYSGPEAFWDKTFENFFTPDWLRFIEELGFKTFLGTSRRYFLEDKKASKFMQAWNQRLLSQGVSFHFSHECVGFESQGDQVILQFKTPFEERIVQTFDAACLCLGGGSYEPKETPLRWPTFFKEKGILFKEFTSSNVGYQIHWKESFLQEADGAPIKNMVLKTKRGTREGEVVITRYGMEGTPVYFVGTPGQAHLDLKPALTTEQIIQKLLSVKENLSLIRRAERRLNLCPATLALLYHHAPEEILKSKEILPFAHLIKNFPLEFLEPQPLAESISSAGGVDLSELTEDLMLKNHPGVFLAGEMLDWDVPTGGFLIQGCVSQGYRAAQGVKRHLKSNT
jgi:uncharacterized flavoprotein (TIGR03862 family)